jgi:nonribosomal peptide synthetase MxcG
VTLPLTAAQAGIWYGQQLDPTSPAYNTADRVDLHGPFEVERFEAALRRAIGEAEGLRAVFGAGEDGPWQRVSDPSWELHRADATEAQAQEWMDRDLATPVDLTAGPVFAQALFRLGPAHHVWYQRVHHVAVDGFGSAMLMRRTAEHYNAGLRSDGTVGPGFAPLRPMVEDDLAYPGSARAEKAREFWREYLSGAPEAVSLAPVAGTPAHRGRRAFADLAPATVAALRAAAGRTATEAMIAAAAVWVHRATAAPEVVLGLPVMGRLGTPAMRVPATVMNIVPLRVRLRTGDTFREVVDRVAEELRRTRPHHRYRHEQLRRDRRLVGTGAPRLFGPVVNVLPFAFDLRLGEATARVRNLSAGPVEDLSLALRELPGGGFRVELDAHPDTYPRETVAAHRDSFVTLVGELGAGPSVVAVAEPSGAGALLVGPALPAVRGVLEAFLDRVSARPEAVAVVDAATSLSYVELHLAATALAGRITAAGAGAGSLVAVALPRGADAVTAILAALLAGAAYLPLDPSAPAARTADLLERARPALVVTSAAHRPAVPRDLPVLLAGDGGAPLPARPGADERELAYVIYTSGSTGEPKGVGVSRRALAHFVAAAGELYGVGPSDRVVQFAPLHFDASVEEIFATLCAGATLVIRPDAPVEAPEAFLRWCAAHGITLLDLPTAYWHELVHALHTGTAALPGTLRGVIIGGDAALRERVAQWHQAAPPHVTLWNTYGPTESTVVATAAVLQPRGRSAGVRG